MVANALMIIFVACLFKKLDDKIPNIVLSQIIKKPDIDNSKD